MAKSKGKSSAAKPSKPSKPRPSSSSLSSSALLTLSLAAAAAAYAAYVLRAPPPPPLSPPAAGGLSPFEQRQQGRTLPGADRPACADAAGCAGVGAAECAAPAVASRCCASCFRATCVDLDAACVEKAQRGACYLEAEYMNATCCHACSPDPEDPCSPDPRVRPRVAEGDLGKIFRRGVEEYPQYAPRVYSEDPWVVGFDNLLTDEECQGVIEAVGGKNGEYLKPSTTAQAVKENGRIVLRDVPDNIRTSWNAWCQHAGCYNHPIHERVITRIMDIVGLPHDYAEHMQLLKYGPGEYYRLHHDWIPEQLQALCGPRVFTFFLYLSDVEEGGGTRFPYIKDKDGKPITVMPRKGTAVWWAHGLESNPWQKDDRTHHEAMPPIKGVKLAANYWIHGSDFKGSMAAGCDGRSGVKGRVWRK